MRQFSEVAPEPAQAILDSHPEVKPTIREIFAGVVFDSCTQPAFAGARGATDSRHVVLRAEELDIHIKISRNLPLQQIMGQVFARNETEFLNNACLQLLQDGQPVKTTWSDNFGVFQFDGVPEGELRLQIELPQLTILGGITIDGKR
jgi:hypothetical protein